MFFQDSYDDALELCEEAEAVGVRVRSVILDARSAELVVLGACCAFLK